jgi:hypothetical protein
MASDPNANIQRNPVEATQGTKRPGLIYVLGGGLVLILIVFAVIWLAQSH